jgi:hypothetical protein
MEICLASADDLRRVWRPWEEPPACPASLRNDAGGSRRTQWRSRDRGQPDREWQARPPGLDGKEACRGRRRQRERSSSLSDRPVSIPLPAAGDRPSEWGLVLLEDLQQRYNLIHRLDLHPDHLPPVRQHPAICRDGKERVGNFLVLGNQLVIQPREKQYARPSLIVGL